MAKKPYTRSQVIARLQALNDHWPDDLALFSWNGSLRLIEREGLVSEHMGSYLIDEVDLGRIPNDGGDPNW